MFKFCINVTVTSRHVTGNVGKVRQVRVTILKGNCYRALNDFLFMQINGDADGLPDLIHWVCPEMGIFQNADGKRFSPPNMDILLFKLTKVNHVNKDCDIRGYNAETCRKNN